MKRNLAAGMFGCAAVLLSFAAIFAEAGVEPPTTRRVLFGQGAFGCLVEAERAAQLGDGAKALEGFRTGLLRALREDRKDIYNRILLRMAGVGKDLATKSFQSGWPLLSQAALLSPNFSAWSARIERWLLENGHPAGRFEYVIVNEDGIAEAWGAHPQKAPIWLYRRLPPATALAAYPGYLYNVRASDLPEQWSYSYCWNIPLRINGTRDATKLEVRGALAPDEGALLSLDSLIRWQPAVPDEKAGALVFETTGFQRIYSVDRFLLVTQGGCPSVELVAVHAYNPL